MQRCTLPAADFLRALRDVRYAVSQDPDEPRLDGIFLDSEPDRLRVVATDRYRLSTSTVATSEATDLHLLLPTAAVDELLAGEHTGCVDVVVDQGTISLSGSGGVVRAQVPAVDFPPYRTLLAVNRREVSVDARTLRTQLDDGATARFTRANDGVPYEVSTLSITASSVQVGGSDEPGAVVVGVNRQFLLQALDCGEQLSIGLDDPITPLAIRNPERDGLVSLLMPVRLDQPA